MFDLPKAKALLLQITQTAAPSFAEDNRAKLIFDLFVSYGYKPRYDESANVIVKISDKPGPEYLFAAHLDTVFDLNTDLHVSEKDGIVSAPGIGDNSASLAVFLLYAEAVSKGLIQPEINLTFAATRGEEGLGDLFGIKAIVNSENKYAYFIALDGYLGLISDRAVGSKRYKVSFTAKGGHSWGDFPSPSAIHALAEAIYRLTKIKMSVSPKNSLNVGIVQGGTSINTIAETASFYLDLRSLEAKNLDRLVKSAKSIIERTAKKQDVKVAIEKIGDRPVARTNNDSLARAAYKAMSANGLEPKLIPGSTDANAAMAAGIPSITFGIYNGGDAHRKTEWVELKSLETGFYVLKDFIELLAG